MAADIVMAVMYAGIVEEATDRHRFRANQIKLIDINPALSYAVNTVIFDSATTRLITAAICWLLVLIDITRRRLLNSARVSIPSSRLELVTSVSVCESVLCQCLVFIAYKFYLVCHYKSSASTSWLISKTP